MQLRQQGDAAVADWLTQATIPKDQLITFGPPGFDRYSRLRYLPDPSHVGELEIDAERDGREPVWLKQAVAGLTVLAKWTATPNDCFFCYWEGGSSLPSYVTSGTGVKVSVPSREYFLLRGSLEEYIADGGDIGSAPSPIPSFVWPADRQWCFASDVDAHWAGISATKEATDCLLNTPDVDAVLAKPIEPQPRYG